MRLRGRLFYAYARLNARSAARQLKSSDVVVVDRLTRLDIERAVECARTSSLTPDTGRFPP